MKIFQKIFFGISIIFFIGLSYISFFNVFQTDDYIYASQTRDLGVLGNIFDFYKNWGGRYFSYSLNTLIPAGNFNFNWLPKDLPIFYIILLIFGFYKNLRLYFGLNLTDALQKSFILFLFYTICLTNISEHYFWISGANIYFLSIILANFLIYFLGKLKETKSLKFIVVLFIALLMGSNEIMAIYLLLYLIYKYVETKNKENLLFLLTGIAFFLFSFLAPGNFNRMTDSETNFWLKNAKRIGVFFINTGYIGLKVVLITPLFIKIFEEEIKNIVSKIPIKKIKIALSFSLITLLFSGYLMLLATGRVLETITFYTLLLGSILLHYYFKKLKNYYLVSTIIIFLPVFTLFIHKKNKIELNYNLNLIAQEILFTPLSKYENEIKERHQTLRKSNEKEVLLLPIKTIPRVLYFEEIGDKKEPNYINIQLEKFYKKQGVFLKTKRN